jgi:hypothetical protein
MKKLNFIFGIMLLSIIFGCSKDKVNVDQNLNQCGTVADISWISEVTNSNFYGNWIITNVSYSKGSGSTHIFDTTYCPNMSLILNEDGTGFINTTQLFWELSNSGGLPKVTISEFDTLFPFSVNFFINDVTDLSIQAPPHSKILFSAGRSVNGQWEHSYINIEKQ